MVRVARNERERRSVSNVAARRVYFRIPLEYLHPLSFLDLREFRDLSKRGEKEKGVSPFFLSFFPSLVSRVGSISGERKTKVRRRSSNLFRSLDAVNRRRRKDGSISAPLAAHK